MNTTLTLADGGRLSVQTEGEGPPLLLVRPLGGSLVSWEPFAAALARDVRVVMYDPRGAGCSSAAPFPTTTRAMARDAVAVLDGLGIARVSVYGLSLGGMVTTWLAIDHPARVDRVVLASTPVRGLTALGGWRRGLACASCLPRPPRAAEACLAKAVLSEEFRAAHPDEVARIQERAGRRPGSHRGLATLFGAAITHDATDHIAGLAAPTLVLAGERDTLLAPARQRELAAALPAARFASISGAGHDASAESPAAVAALVLDHLSATH